MTLTWSDLAEAPTSLPAEAVTDLSQVEVVGYHRHVLSPPDASGTALVRDALTERFAGGLDGEGHAEHLRVVAADGSNTFVGAERFDGRLTGRCGSFALTAHGTTTADGLVRGAWRVVAGSATGELRGLRGRGAFTARQHADGVWRSEDRFTHWYEPEEAATVATTAPAARPQGRHDRGAHGELVDAGRARLYVERRGSGPAVLFIPGGGVDASHFAAVAELLADAFTTVTYDRRGYFRSPPPPGWQPASLDEQADDAAGLLQRLGLGPAAVWGGSLGGIILLGLLRRHPGLVAAALVHEPPLFTLLDDRDQHLQRLADMGAQARRLGVRPVMAQHARAELGEAFDRLAAGARTRMLANAEAFLRIDVPGLARSMPSPDALTSHVPTAVLASPESRNTPPGPDRRPARPAAPGAPHRAARRPRPLPDRPRHHRGNHPRLPTATVGITAGPRNTSGRLLGFVQRPPAHQGPGRPTVIAGPVAEQAAPRGLRASVRSLGLPLPSVRRIDPEQEPERGAVMPGHPIPSGPLRATRRQRLRVTRRQRGRPPAAGIDRRTRRGGFPTEGRSMSTRCLLDELLPRYDIAERHQRVVAAPPERVWQAIQAVTLRELPLAWLLFALRSLPARLTHGRGLPRAADRPLLAQLWAAGFARLGEDPGRELVGGVVGQMWKPAGGEAVRVNDGAGFAAFQWPGFVKAAMSFRIAARQGGTLVETETRALATDPVSRRRFARYWRLIGPGSAAIRRSWLRAAARRATGAGR